MSQEQHVKNEEVLEEANQPAQETVEEIFAEAEVEATQEADVETQANELEEAKAQIADLEAKLEAAENRNLRLQADFDNIRRRSRLEAEASEKYRAQSLITDLLPALDNFERALAMTTENDETKSLQQGMEMVYKSLLEALKKEGVELIDAVGKEFDPNFHQAVMQVEDANFGSNIVVDEFQKGYCLKDRVIRPSMVKVNQ
ncbi:nucleotide exchange factor GrpE [Bacillus sp. DNRA2]|uniref:nucleotide exchange factor GrpE n=1 Tax=Bacillus sp. DNRA2 TaxID=2723053 RepID=UPI00145F51F2|nr:nucleotide exchange factor GrpE [Bacillus sp. DNRA2]NMD70646.1 nucleotide exchange factor GrpE [Bacillus sp. DNRA2]